MKTSFFFLTLLTVSPLAHSQTTPSGFQRRDLISDIAGADNLDKNLVNPWGIAFSPTGPFWINNEGTGLSTVYDSNGKPAPAATPLIITIPLPAATPASGSSSPTASGPTGIVFNPTAGFEVSPGKPSVFIFATVNGTISAWSPQVDSKNAVIKVDNSAAHAVYTGLTMAANDRGTFLYAANFRNRTIDVFNTGFFPAWLRGTFSDPGIPLEFSPFNIQDINGKLYVTYAKRDPDKGDEVIGVSNGYVNVFDTDGRIIQRFASTGTLNAPWGVVLTPASFGSLANTVLIGNFGDGRIQAFDPATGAPKGLVVDSAGKEIAIPGLWSLIFGNGGQGGDATALYFTAGIAGGGKLEDHGVLGAIRPVSPLAAPTGQ